MRASREALFELASAYGYDRRIIIFDEPDETARVEVALADETQAARQVAETVEAELRPAADELQGAT
jgi:predicted kinase